MKYDAGESLRTFCLRAAGGHSMQIIRGYRSLHMATVGKNNSEEILSLSHSPYIGFSQYR